MKSTITCDMEGVIETMNEGAEKIFGYKKEELIGKKRVSLFSPGEIVLQNVAGWLDTAVKKGEYVGETYFVNKNGEKINAKIRITPTFSNGKDQPQTGYCGVTEVIEKEVHVPIEFSTKMIKGLAITRMPFTSASILPIFVVAAYLTFASLENIDLTKVVEMDDNTDLKGEQACSAGGCEVSVCFLNLTDRLSRRCCYHHKILGGC